MSNIREQLQPNPLPGSVEASFLVQIYPSMPSLDKDAQGNYTQDQITAKEAICSALVAVGYSYDNSGVFRFKYDQLSTKYTDREMLRKAFSILLNYGGYRQSRGAGAKYQSHFAWSAKLLEKATIGHPLFPNGITLTPDEEWRKSMQNNKDRRTAYQKKKNTYVKKGDVLDIFWLAGLDLVVTYGTRYPYVSNDQGSHLKCLREWFTSPDSIERLKAWAVLLSTSAEINALLIQGRICVDRGLIDRKALSLNRDAVMAHFNYDAKEYENFRRRIWPMILDPLVRESLRLKALSEEKGSVYHPSSFPSPPSTVDSELGASVVATHLKRRRLLKCVGHRLDMIHNDTIAAKNIGNKLDLGSTETEEKVKEIDNLIAELDQPFIQMMRVLRRRLDSAEENDPVDVQPAAYAQALVSLNATRWARKQKTIEADEGDISEESDESADEDSGDDGEDGDVGGKRQGVSVIFEEPDMTSLDQAGDLGIANDDEAVLEVFDDQLPTAPDFVDAMKTVADAVALDTQSFSRQSDNLHILRLTYLSILAIISDSENAAGLGCKRGQEGYLARSSKKFKDQIQAKGGVLLGEQRSFRRPQYEENLKRLSAVPELYPELPEEMWDRICQDIALALSIVVCTTKPFLYATIVDAVFNHISGEGLSRRHPKDVASIIVGIKELTTGTLICATVGLRTYHPKVHSTTVPPWLAATIDPYGQFGYCDDDNELRWLQ